MAKGDDKFYKVTTKAWMPRNTEHEVEKAFIPTDVPYEGQRAGSPIEQVVIATNQGFPVLLLGETGTGKTSLVRHLAHATGNGFIRVNHNGGTTVEDIVGRYLLDQNGTKWVDGALIKAMRDGLWYLADEINASSADINFVYHQLLDDDARVTLVEKDHEVVSPHPNFKFFAAMNPPGGDYAGAKELNKALMSRFAVVKVPFLPPKIEEKVLMNRTGVNEDTAERMVRFAGEVRTAKNNDQYSFVLSTRDLLMWASLFKTYKKYLPAADVAVLNKVTDEDYQAIKEMLGLHFKALDAPATAKVGIEGEVVDEVSA